MGLLDSQLAIDAEALVDTDGLGESITYTPRGGSARTINGVVFREPPEAVRGVPAGSQMVYHVEVRNHATLGIDAASINTGGDTLTIALKLGGTTTVMPINRVVSQDAGMLRLRVG